MSLENLLGVSLETITPAKQTIRRLLDGASRHIADAKVTKISAETRFGSARRAFKDLRARRDDVYGFGTGGRATFVNPKTELRTSEGEAPTQGRPA